MSNLGCRCHDEHAPNCFIGVALKEADEREQIRDAWLSGDPDILENLLIKLFGDIPLPPRTTIE